MPIVGGVIMLLLIILVGTRVLGGSGPEPTARPTKVAVVTTPTELVAPTQALATPETPEPPPATAPFPTDTLAPTATPFKPNTTDLQDFMHQLINQDRENNGLSALAWDGTAAIAGSRHAEKMNLDSYLSHWNTGGYGPEYRYTQAGGRDAVFENVYYYEHSPGAGPASASDWQDIVRKAQSDLMNSPGHRDNILAPEHTHVGVGIAYDEKKGRLSIAQEFVNRYVVLESLSLRASLGETISVQGRLLGGASNPLINLAYEPTPEHLTASDLNATDTYEPAAKIFDAVSLTADADGSFSQTVVLDNAGQPGLYHILVWVDTAFGQTLAAQVVIYVK